MKLLKNTVSVLYALSSSSTVTFHWAIGLVLPFPLANVILLGFAFLLVVVKDIGASYDALVDLLEVLQP
ncbi:hypothetical protein BJV74DRAFT_888820 [Russula compacta]|nr:hypothetical protein BJV74DRAFT_888820 [Russula compacta]